MRFLGPPTTYLVWTRDSSIAHDMSQFMLLLSSVWILDTG